MQDDANRSGLAGFMIRVSPVYLKQIESLVSQGLFASKSDFGRAAIIQYLSHLPRGDFVVTPDCNGSCESLLESLIERKIQEALEKAPVSASS